VNKWTTVVPGFRTNKTWKKVMAGIFYGISLLVNVALLIGMFGSQDSRITSLQVFISWLLVVTIPFIIATSFLGLGKRLPLFRSRRVVTKILAWAISLPLLFVGSIIVFGLLDSLHTKEYQTAMAESAEQAAVEAQEKKRLKLEEKQLLAAAKADEEAAQQKEEEQKRAEEARAEQERAEQEQTERERAEEEKREQTEQERAEEEKRGQTEQERAEEEKREQTEQEHVENQEQERSEEQEAQERQQNEEREGEAVKHMPQQQQPVQSNNRTAVGDANAKVDKPEADDKASGTLAGYTFKSERKKFSQAKIDKWLQQEPYYLEVNSKLLKASYFKRTLDSSSLIYYGDLKDNMPDGAGMLLEVRNSGIAVTVYVGGFKAGRFDDYGVSFSSMPTAETDLDNKELVITYAEQEGYFKNNKLHGKGNIYWFNPFILFSEESFPGLGNKNLAAMDKKLAAERGDREYLILPSELSAFGALLQANGTYKKGELDGEGKLYANGTLLYDGSFKGGRYDGKGKLYFDKKKLQYEGEFKKGKYNGQGTLYREDGSVVYKGEWKNGELK
jgi:hypothetical protein